MNKFLVIEGNNAVELESRLSELSGQDVTDIKYSTCMVMPKHSNNTPEIHHFALVKVEYDDDVRGEINCALHPLRRLAINPDLDYDTKKKLRTMSEELHEIISKIIRGD